MRQELEKVRFLTGNAQMIEGSAQTPALPTWSERVTDFFAAFSRNLMADPRSRRFEDIMSYAFWIRKASLSQIREHYYADVYGKLGRGVAFHIAPSNVPINFAVSFTSAFLAGNVNIVRLSNKPFEQVQIITDALKKTFSEGMEWAERYLILIRYEHDDAVTAYLSSLCDVRIIWGGNRTIEQIRKAPLPPRAIEMAFADRHSLALLDAEAVLKADAKKLAADFYIDTYYTDQNACSSPRMVVWFGETEKVARAQEYFWEAVEALVSERYEFQPIQAIDKLEQFCLLAAEQGETAAQAEGFRDHRTNRMVRVQVGKATEMLMDYKLGGGYFFEMQVRGMDELLPVLGKPCQTISFYGLDRESLQNFVLQKGIRGVDRIVPIGKTMDLTFKWDGYDMIQNMSRSVYAPEYQKTNSGKCLSYVD